MSGYTARRIPLAVLFVTSVLTFIIGFEIRGTVNAQGRAYPGPERIRDFRDTEDETLLAEPVPPEMHVQNDASGVKQGSMVKWSIPGRVRPLYTWPVDEDVTYYFVIRGQKVAFDGPYVPTCCFQKKK